MERVDKEVLHNLMKEVQNKEELDPRIIDFFEKAIKKVYANSSVQEVQPFIDKFCKKEGK